tara:strand:+ start:1649 stop:1858 length:210 start_codon:yes stop_codon:yes gene_type:complete
MALLKVDGHNGYLKDTDTGIIQNNNVSEIEAARMRKAQKKQQEEDINNLKNEVGDIKKMLTEIIEKLNG